MSRLCGEPYRKKLARAGKLMIKLGPPNAPSVRPPRNCHESQDFEGRGEPWKTPAFRPVGLGRRLVALPMVVANLRSYRLVHYIPVTPFTSTELGAIMSYYSFPDRQTQTGS